MLNENVTRYYLVRTKKLSVLYTMAQTNIMTLKILRLSISLFSQLETFSMCHRGQSRSDPSHNFNTLNWTSTSHSCSTRLVIV